MLAPQAFRRGIFRKKATPVVDLPPDAGVDTWAAAIVTRGGTALTTAQKQAFYNFVGGLKSDAGNTWARISRFLWMGVPSLAGGSFVDLVDSTKIWTPSVTGAFTPLQGVQGDASTVYVSSIDNIGGLFTQKDASVFGLINGWNGVSGAQDEFGSSGTVLRLSHSNTTASNNFGIINSASGAALSAGTPSDRLGFSCAVRQAPVSGTDSDLLFWRNPTSSAPNTTRTDSVSSAVAASPMYALARGSGAATRSPDRALGCGYGGSLTGAQVLAIKTRMIALANALGCPLS